jgi:hypothetical protein
MPHPVGQDIQMKPVPELPDSQSNDVPRRAPIHGFVASQELFLLLGQLLLRP